MTHAQATSAGLTRTAISRLVRAGKWQVVRPRVFRRAAAAQTEEQSLLAVCLWIGESAVVSHRSAARLYGLDLPLGDPEVTTEPRFATRAEDVIVHRVSTLEDQDRRLLRGIPITTGARTVIDLASCLDDEPLAIVVEEAWRKNVAAPSWMSDRLEQLTEHGGQGRPSRVLAEILADCLTRPKPLESALEVRVWRLLKHAGLKPTPDFEFRDDHGQPGRLDFAFPECALAIEADGFQTHGEREGFERDRVRNARLAALGWRVVPVTWRQLDEQPRQVVQRIREALRYRTVPISEPLR
jgi:very-short-patch-repair endonuclease